MQQADLGPVSNSQVASGCELLDEDDRGREGDAGNVCPKDEALSLISSGDDHLTNYRVIVATMRCVGVVNLHYHPQNRAKG